MEKVKQLFKEHRLFILGLTVSLFLIVVDQITKTMAVRTITDLQTKTAFVHDHIAITRFFNVVLVWNKGISFGVLNDRVWSNFVLLPLVLIIALFILVQLFKTRKIYQVSTYSVILAGAVGNIIDRLHYGAVVDFLDFYIGTHHWPAFNIADSCICIGVVLLLLEDILNKKTTHHH